jgi:hypothetical protein
VCQRGELTGKTAALKICKGKQADAENQHSPEQKLMNRALCRNPCGVVELENLNWNTDELLEV